jgi:Fic family protein
MPGDRFRAFVPKPLPPKPAVRVDTTLVRRTELAIAELNALSGLLPDTSHFVYSYVRKEALLSSQIEGTQSSLADLLLYETKQAPGVPVQDVREVSDYVAALDAGVGKPVTVALLKRLHRRLLRSTRGGEKSPGQYRRHAVSIGGDRPSRARFVPPPASRVAACMRELDGFLKSDTAPLLKIGLAHVQLETIHPFRDGNGRIGRLMVSLLLCSEGLMREPLLYASTYLKAHRREYYDRLQAVRTEGDWEGWMKFFLDGLGESARDALDTARRILALFDRDRRGLEGAALTVYDALQRRPIATVGQLQQATGLTFPTVGAALAKMPFVRELTGGRRNRVFVYAPYVALLSAGDAPLPRI